MSNLNSCGCFQKINYNYDHNCNLRIIIALVNKLCQAPRSSCGCAPLRSARMTTARCPYVATLNVSWLQLIKGRMLILSHATNVHEEVCQYVRAAQQHTQQGPDTHHSFRQSHCTQSCSEVLQGHSTHCWAFTHCIGTQTLSPSLLVVKEANSFTFKLWERFSSHLGRVQLSNTVSKDKTTTAFRIALQCQILPQCLDRWYEELTFRMFIKLSTSNWLVSHWTLLNNESLWTTWLIQRRSFRMTFFALIIMLRDTCFRFLEETVTFRFICIICVMLLVSCCELFQHVPDYWDRAQIGPNSSTPSWLVALCSEYEAASHNIDSPLSHLLFDLRPYIVACLSLQGGGLCATSFVSAFIRPWWLVFRSNLLFLKAVKYALTSSFTCFKAPAVSSVCEKPPLYLYSFTMICTCSIIRTSRTNRHRRSCRDIMHRWLRDTCTALLSLRTTHSSCNQPESEGSWKSEKVAKTTRRRSTRPRCSAQFVRDGRNEWTDEVKIRVPAEVPRDTRICIEDVDESDIEIDQSKEHEKKGKQPGTGTQEPLNKQTRTRTQEPKKKTTRDRDPRTCEKGHANSRQNLRKASGTRRRERRGLRQAWLHSGGRGAQFPGDLVHAGKRCARTVESLPWRKDMTSRATLLRSRCQLRWSSRRRSTSLASGNRVRNATFVAFQERAGQTMSVVRKGRSAILVSRSHLSTVGGLYAVSRAPHTSTALLFSTPSGVLAPAPFSAADSPPSWTRRCRPPCVRMIFIFWPPHFSMSHEHCSATTGSRQ